jgi:thiamine pyrophosphate-dependent acetolactate synthase large subunit-like protein
VLRNYQVQSGRKPVGVALNSPDFSKLAEGYGVAYRRITTSGELSDALGWALGEVLSRSVLIEFEGELQAPGQSI